MTSSSAFAANANAYQTNPTPAWDMYTSGNTVDDWTSPFVDAAPNDVTQVPGYPTYSGGDYQWEWSMVYEWSVNLGPEGANCGDQPIFVVTGLSHHSPSKNGDENDDFPPPEDFQFSDWGDVPDSYGTTNANNGARHYITVNGPYFGNEVQGEPDGTPTNDATGDGAEEDGVTFTLLGANTIRASVDLVNNTGGSVTVCAWLDIPSGGTIDGTFDASDGLCQDTSLSSTTLTFDWSGLPVDQQYDTYARFRITGDTLTTSDAAGTASNGEIEDYTVSFDFTPTLATIGEVDLEAASLEGFVTGLALQEMGAPELADLLKVWDPEAASALTGADRAVLLDAVLNYLDPDRDGQVALLRWDTLEQRGTIGFYVERSTGSGTWSRINNDLLPALVDAPMGAEYQLVDPTARSGQSYEYRLIEQEAAGTTRTYGPYAVEMP